jgi:hypothetical protein
MLSMMRFPSVRLQPLGHLSARGLSSDSNRARSSGVSAGSPSASSPSRLLRVANAGLKRDDVRLRGRDLPDTGCLGGGGQRRVAEDDGGERGQDQVTTMIVLPDGEEILDVICGDKDFWVISATHNLAA